MSNEPSRPFQRARQPEHKELRRTEILTAAAKLLDEHGVGGTGLSAIAREAQISKGNIYRYFESREAVLLSLLLEEHETWRHDVEVKLAAAQTGDAESVADALTFAIVSRPRLCELFAALAGVLERNLSREAIVDFKRDVAERGSSAVSALQAAMPKLSQAACHSVLMQQFVGVCGSWPHCHPAPVVSDVLQDEEFAAMRLDFAELTRSHTLALLHGHATIGESD